MYFYVKSTTKKKCISKTLMVNDRNGLRPLHFWNDFHRQGTFSEFVQPNYKRNRKCHKKFSRNKISWKNIKHIKITIGIMNYSRTVALCPIQDESTITMWSLRWVFLVGWVSLFIWHELLILYVEFDFINRFSFF